jgi:hypothetical protein
MGQKRVEDPDFVVTVPAFLLVRTPDMQNAAEMVRSILRLAGRGHDGVRRWFVPVFRSEEAAARLADDVKKIDKTLRVIQIGSFRDLAILLDAMLTNGDQYTAFDPQPTHAEHIAINFLLAEIRQRLPGGGDVDFASGPGDRDARSSWLRRRPAINRTDSPEPGNGKSRPEAAGRS